MRKALVVAVMALAGCSIIDTPCKTFGEVHCISPTAAAYCLGTEYHWTEIACPGKCATGSPDTCSFFGVEADVPCPASIEGKGHCEVRLATNVAVYCDTASKRWVVDPCPTGCREYTTELGGTHNGEAHCY